MRLPIRQATLCAALGLLSAATGVAAQKERDPAAGAPVDPYTGGDPAWMERAGIVGYHPFMLGPEHDTFDVEGLLGGIDLRWIETAHFKIGSSLPDYVIPQDSAERKKLRAELGRLSKKLYGVRSKTRKLDRWLRLHLFAQRAEEVYADFSKRLGVTDADFPRKGEQIFLNENYMGLGPYLGQCDKYLLLIMQRESSAGRYTNRYLNEIFRYPKRFNMGRESGLGFVTATEFDGWLTGDSALHCHVVYNVVQNLCDGFKHYGHDVPVWFKGGLAQWYLRRVDPRFNNYDRPPDGKPDGRAAWDWEPTVRSLVKFDHVRPIEEMISWFDYAPYKFTDYIVNWSRVDYLMTLGDECLSVYMHRMKTPITDGRTLPSRAAVLELQNQAIEEAWGFDLATFDRRWRKYVTAKYKKS